MAGEGDGDGMKIVDLITFGFVSRHSSSRNDVGVTKTHINIDA
jgi:hypothetical protein